MTNRRNIIKILGSREAPPSPPDGFANAKIRPDIIPP
jgi:hypothetical protein